MTPRGGPTPAFVRWSLEVPCELRCMVDQWRSPEATERLLRPLREISGAEREARLFRGVVLENSLQVDATLAGPPLGFPADEVFEGFGGEDHVASLCAACPANVACGRAAGCFGLIHEWAFGADFASEFDREMDRRELRNDFTQHFPAASPAFFGVWMASPFTREQCVVLLSLLRDTAQSPDSQQALFVQALHVSIEASILLWAELFPPGEVRGRSWRVESHCPHCKAPRPETSRRCPVCGVDAHASPSRKRKAKGIRPFMNLSDLLGSDAVSPFLREYFAARGESAESIERFEQRNQHWLGEQRSQ